VNHLAGDSFECVLDFGGQQGAVLESDLAGLAL